MADINTRGFIVTVNSKDAGDLNSLGAIKMNRPIKEYEAINTGTIVQALGNIKTDPIVMSVIYDTEDTAGAKELETAFFDGSTIPMAIELSDIVTPTTGNGTTFTWDGVVIKDFELNPEQDGKVIATFTASMNGKPTVTAAA